MIELYLSKVTDTSESEQAGKLYARVSYKQTLGIMDMARHMAEHNTAFSEGLITGILIDFVRCVREQVLNGNTVKIDNLAIFKATVEANGMETLYDAQTEKVAQASIGTLKSGDKTGPAVKTIKLLAQSTGEFTRDELKKDAKLGWTDKAKAEIAAAKGETAPASGSNGSQNGGSNGSSQNENENQNENQGGSSQSGSSGSQSGSQNSGSGDSSGKPTISGIANFQTSTTVTITGPEGATIRYTNDGSTPTATSGEVYTEPFTLNDSATIKAVAVVDGVASEVTTRVFTKSSGD